MKVYILVALLPYIWAADIPGIQCPDGNICSVGQTCCGKGGHFECCDIPEPDQQNKKLVPAYLSSNVQNVSNAVCQGTMCSTDWCCEFPLGTCCSGLSCCPKGYKCCGTSPPNEWCCKTNQRCAATYMYCIAGAAALTPAFLSLIAVFLVAVALMHF